MNQKIKDIRSLAQTLKEYKKKGKKIVLCHGVFDLIHIGHIKYFQAAKKQGDILVVTVTPDKFVNKGPKQPVFSVDLRLESIAALEVVDYVAKNEWPTAVEAIKLLCPDLYVKGAEYKNQENDVTGEIINEEEAIKFVKGDMIYTDEITFSSTKLINEHFSHFSQEIKDYLKNFKIKYSQNEILTVIDSFAELEILLIGESIIDDYEYGIAIGKSSKDPHLVIKHLRYELHAGGVLAIANHLAEFCKKVTVVTYLGDTDSYEEFIRESLAKNIELIVIYKKNSPTIYKRRIIDEYHFQKLIEIYNISDEALNDDQENELIRILDKEIDKNNFIMVADYGHGFLNTKTINQICAIDKFFALNVQCNAGNYGYNFVSKYSNAKFITIDEREIKLESRNRDTEINVLLKQLAKKVNFDNIIVTRGSAGSTSFSVLTDCFDTPAFANKIVDRVGAGDAYFAIASMFAARESPLEEIAFVGNVVGALAVEVVGNKLPVSKIKLKKSIISILK